MAILIISLINWIFVRIQILKAAIALAIFITVEIKRKKKTANGAMIAGEFISALILISNILLLII
jgi:hypothetical protein